MEIILIKVGAVKTFRAHDRFSGSRDLIDKGFQHILGKKKEVFYVSKTSNLQGVWKLH